MIGNGKKCFGERGIENHGTTYGLLEEQGFVYSQNGVDVVKVTKDDVLFVGYRMNRDNLSIVVGNNYACLYLPDGESLLFSSSEVKTKKDERR